MDLQEAKIVVVLSMPDKLSAAKEFQKIVSKIEWMCDNVEDVYLEEPPIEKDIEQ